MVFKEILLHILFFSVIMIPAHSFFFSYRNLRPKRVDLGIEPRVELFLNGIDTCKSKESAFSTYYSRYEEKSALFSIWNLGTLAHRAIYKGIESPFDATTTSSIISELHVFMRNLDYEHKITTPGRPIDQKAIGEAREKLYSVLKMYIYPLDDHIKYTDDDPPFRLPVSDIVMNLAETTPEKVIPFLTMTRAVLDSYNVSTEKGKFELDTHTTLWKYEIYSAYHRYFSGPRTSQVFNCY